MPKTRAHVFVNGKVQGVFFRHQTRREAESRGVTGWVRNLPDGRVEAVFEGEENAVDALVEFCKVGPAGAVITDVDVEFENFTGDFRNFRITF